MAKVRAKLTARERLFIQEYLIDFNGAAAVRRAGYKAKAQRQLAFELLTKPYILDEINRLMGTRMKKIELNADFTLTKLKALANSNIKNVAHWAEGGLILKDSAMLTAEEAFGIESIQLKQTLRGPEVRVKMRQPDRALDMLGRHQGLFDIGDQTEPTKELNEAIDALDAEEGKNS